MPDRELKSQQFARRSCGNLCTSWWRAAPNSARKPNETSVRAGTQSVFRNNIDVHQARFAESYLPDSSLPLATSVAKDAICTRIFVANSVKSAINSEKNIKNYRLTGRAERISPDLSQISGQNIQEFNRCGFETPL